jgi:TetR/AcrR family transcriptional regulator
MVTSKSRISDPQPQPGREKLILQAARKEFIAKGLSGGRMQAIAASAGVNKALLHYYYRSKEGLYTAALAEVLQNVWQSIRAELANRTPDRDFSSLVHIIVSTYINALAENTDFARMILREIADGGAMMPEIIRGFVASYDDVIKQVGAVIRKSRKAKTIRPVSPVHLAMNIMGMCAATFIARFILEANPLAVKLGITFDHAFFEERIREITAMTLHGIEIKGESS